MGRISERSKKPDELEGKQVTLDSVGHQARKYYFMEWDDESGEYKNIKDLDTSRILGSDTESGKSLVDALALDRETATPLGIVTSVYYDRSDREIKVRLRKISDKDLKGLKR